jgi:hypothetical protein
LVSRPTPTTAPIPSHHLRSPVATSLITRSDVKAHTNASNGVVDSRWLEPTNTGVVATTTAANTWPNRRAPNARAINEPTTVTPPSASAEGRRSTGSAEPPATRATHAHHTTSGGWST